MMQIILPILLIAFYYMGGCSDTTADKNKERPNVSNVGHDFNPEGCEYIVTFPMNPQYKKRGSTSRVIVSAISTEESGLPALRADCLPEENPSRYTKEDMLAILDVQSKSSALSNIKLSVENTNLGKIGTYTGEIDGPMATFVLIGKWYLGSDHRSTL